MKIKWITVSANFGALQVDARLPNVSRLISKDIRNTLENLDSLYYGISNTIRLDIEAQDVRTEKYKVDVAWSLALRPGHPEFIGGVSELVEESRNYQRHTLILNLALDQLSKDSIKYAISHSLAPILLHEVKHILDKVDGKVTIHQKGRPTENDSSTKYMSHGSEFDAWLITLITEIYRFKNKMSFEEALLRCESWPAVIEALTGSRLNKFKAKLAHFWNT